LALPAAPTPSPGAYFESQTFGIRVRLPPGWRRATHPQLALVRPNGTGREVFTVRTEDEDRQLLEPVPVGHAGSYPVLSHTAVLNVLENPKLLSTTTYLAQSMSPPPAVNFSVSGRPAVRIDESFGFGVSTIHVARDNVMIRFEPYFFRLPGWLPSGWTDQKLAQDMQALIDSLELTR
jgi:hypothetical protein